MRQAIYGSYENYCSSGAGALWPARHLIRPLFASSGAIARCATVLAGPVALACAAAMILAPDEPVATAQAMFMNVMVGLAGAMPAFLPGRHVPRRGRIH
jgi:hypothetical protein